MQLKKHCSYSQLSYSPRHAHQMMLIDARVRFTFQRSDRSSMYVVRPVAVSAMLAGPMRLGNPESFELQDQQTPEPLQAVMQLGLVLVSPAQA